jgi:immune inhibitor A
METKSPNWSKWLILGITGLIMVCCCCGAIISYFTINAFLKGFQHHAEVTQTQPFGQRQNQIFTPTSQPTDEPLDQAKLTYKAISESVIPYEDRTETAFRLGRIQNLDQKKVDAPNQYKVGDKASFWVLNQDTDAISNKTAFLRLITPHAYFWIEKGRAYNSRDLQSLAQTFEDQIYPRTREIFGSEWIPGVDNDEHIFILYTDGLGDGIAGMFSSDNSLKQDVYIYSNEHEMFYLAGDQKLSDPYAYGVLAHEFNHMILWNQDLNEDTWVAEGLADLASYLNGYDTGGFDQLFAADPDLQLNIWPKEADAEDAHYGSSFLFITYLYSRFGEKAIQELMSAPANGFEGVDEVINRLGLFDPETGRPFKADQIFGDWAVANYLNDPLVYEGRYSYQQNYLAPTFPDTEISQCTPEWQQRSVSQFGTDYVRLDCSGELNLEFKGVNTVSLIQGLDEGNNHFFWSNRSDSSQTTLTRAFDVPPGNDPIWMDYRVWYDLEDGYDYGYLLAKTDDSTWKIIETESCTLNNPVGANLGCGYTGLSNGWRDQRVDLSEYAGKKVELQFVAITDGAVNNQGILIDDISIPAIGYDADFEKDTGGWEANGWVLVQNTLPQSFQVSLIRKGDSPRVDRFTLNEGDEIKTTIHLNPGETLTLVVSGTTRYITTPANYQFHFSKTP